MPQTDEPVPEFKNVECDMTDSVVKDPPGSPRESIDSPEPSEVTNDDRNSEKPFASIEGELDFEDEAENPALEKSGEKGQISEEDGCVESEEEEGLCTPEKKKNDSLEEGEDEGECTEDDQDLEEGELKEEDNGPKKAPRQICKFYNRNQCFFGNECRFLHLNYDHRGNYNMFATSPPKNFPDVFEPSPLVESIMAPPLAMINHRAIVPDFIPPEPPMECAWERGLREAKELLVKASKRKEEEPDFEQKRLNLSLPSNEKVADFERDKENVFSKAKNNKWRDESRFDDPRDNEYEPRAYSDGRYGNFENRRSNWQRPRMRRSSHDRGRFPRFGRRGDQRRDDHLSEIQARSRPDDSYFDPWRRSKSPRGHSRSFSRSVSSYSSRSSYSRSSSSSRSRSRSPSVQRNRKPDVSPKVGVSDSPQSRNNVGTKRNSRTQSYSRSASRSRSSSSRSRSISRSLSRSSRSMSMDSVSSASSSASRSSSGLRGSPISGKRKEKPVSKQQGPEREPSNPPFQSLHHLLPSADKPKEPQIKLTLLNKPQISLPKSKVLDINETKYPEGPLKVGVKRPLSPPTVAEKVALKKCPSSRRDELLKQLKAVEDAIARKKTKFS